MLKKCLIVILICVVPVSLLLSSVVNSNSSNLLLKQVQDYQQEGRYLEALSFYKDIYMNKWSECFSPSFYKGIADIYYEYLGDGESALVFYKKAVEKLPYDSLTPVIFHNIAKIYYGKGERQKAKKFYRDIFSMFPVYFSDNNIEKEIKALNNGSLLLADIVLADDRIFPFYTRVLIEKTQKPVKALSEGAMEISSDNSSFSMKIPSGKTVHFNRQENAILIDNKTFMKGTVEIRAGGSHCVKINGRSYRGFFRVHVRNNHLLVVNHVGLDEYLYGVLPKEISPSWPEEAINAQAVAARTYALYHMVKRQNELYDVFSTTSSQVYGGKDAEHTVTSKAVDLTRGLVLSYNKKIILTLYHANSGGETEGVEDVWGSHLPYLRNVKDEFSLNRPGSSWKLKMSRNEMQKRMTRFGVPDGPIDDIIPIERAVSGRIKKLKISQESEDFFLSGNSFRLMLGAGRVKSANFEAKRKGDKFVFKGKGYGHGVGMSQWGAYGMAKAGYDYRKILGFYYQGTEIKRVALVQAENVKLKNSNAKIAGTKLQRHIGTKKK